MEGKRSLTNHGNASSQTDNDEAGAQLAFVGEESPGKTQLESYRLAGKDWKIMPPVIRREGLP